MPFRNRMYVFAIIGLTLFPATGYSQEEVQVSEDATNVETSQQADTQPPNLVPALENIESAIRELVREESEEESQRAANQAAQDLEAQKEMAKWAMEMALAAIAGAIFTLLGLFLIWRTLIVSRETLTTTQDMALDQRRIGEAQVKAYLHAKFNIDVKPTGTTEEDYNFTLKTTIVNVGLTPAFVEAFDFTHNRISRDKKLDFSPYEALENTSADDADIGVYVPTMTTNQAHILPGEDNAYIVRIDFTNDQVFNAYIKDGAMDAVIGLELRFTDVFDKRFRYRIANRISFKKSRADILKMNINNSMIDFPHTKECGDIED